MTGILNTQPAMKQVKNSKTHTGEFSEYQASKHTAVLNLCVLKKINPFIRPLRPYVARVGKRPFTEAWSQILEQ